MLKAQVQATSPRSFRTKKGRSSNYKVLSTSVECLTQLCPLQPDITHFQYEKARNWNPTNHFHSFVHLAWNFKAMHQPPTNSIIRTYGYNYQVVVDWNSNPGPHVNGTLRLETEQLPTSYVDEGLNKKRQYSLCRVSIGTQQIA